MKLCTMSITGVTLRNRRSPCGERGLKYIFIFASFNSFKCRSPCGERGLK